MTLKIPSTNIAVSNLTKQFSQPNTSDLFGNIFYTKNINFDEQGYIKLSNRSASLKNDAEDTNFGVVPSFGRLGTGQFFIPTNNKPFVVTLSDLSSSVTPDGATGAPSSLRFTTRAVWWQGRWHVVSGSANSIFYRTVAGSSWQNITAPVGANPLGNWDASTNTPTIQSGIGTAGNYYIANVAGNTNIDGTNVWNVGDWIYFNGSNWVKANPTSILNTSMTHAIEVFRNRNTLCVSDGNKVLQFDTSYVHVKESDLVLQTDYEVIGMAYSGNRLGIITRLASGIQGENVDAYFFVWDGGSPSANLGFPIGSDQAIAVAPYKSSWVILTRKGQLLQYNGGGFDVLATLPFYFHEQLWGDFLNFLAYGNAIQVDGDLIFINIPGNINQFGVHGQTYAPYFPTGVWCYDSKVGLYHRYSPSISPVQICQVNDSGVDTATDELTPIGGTIPPTGSPVRYVFHTGSAIGGLEKGVTYYIINDTSSFKLATTKDDAIAGTAINLTSAGGTTHSFYALTILDYGASRSSRNGAIALQGVYKQTYERIIYSGYYPSASLASENAHLCLDIPYFEARGRFVIAKQTSSAVEDEYNNIYVKYSPLKENDSIIIKYKSQEVSEIPISTDNSGVTWVDPTSFTTTQDISEAYDLFNSGNSGSALECDVISGAGAGQTSQIASFAYDAPSSTYTITLEDTLDGISAGNRSDVCLDNWTYADTIDSNNPDGYKEVPISVPSKWILVSVEMRGVRVRVEEVQIVNGAIRKTQ